ncbi:MAG TPA: hypothetical protein GXZ43_08910 [Clostridiaceae bacterium]|nr:hypothetical protein [Clostridiaceae bacterium]
MREHVLFLFSNREAKVRKDVITKIKNFTDNNRNLDVYYLITQHADHLKELVKEFAYKHGEKGIIFVAGGDGSINEATNVIANLQTNTALGVLPFGTANDFCKLHYNKFNLDYFLNDLSRLKISPVDLLQLTGNMQLIGDGPDTIFNNDLALIKSTYVMNVASIGLDTEILKTAFHYLHKSPWLKGSAYTFAVLKHFFNLQTREYIFSFKNKDHQIDSLLAAFCNGGFYGNGFNPAPGCDLQDNLLNYVIAPKFNHLQFAKLAIHYKNGSIETQKDKLNMGLLNKISVKSADGKPFIGNFDGIIFETEHLQIDVVPKKIPFAFVGDYSQRLITDKSSIID